MTTLLVHSKLFSVLFSSSENTIKNWSYLSSKVCSQLVEKFNASTVVHFCHHKPKNWRCFPTDLSEKTVGQMFNTEQKLSNFKAKNK